MERLLYSLDGNKQRLDGGAMFGNAPRALWERWSPPDDHNRIDLATRCLLVREPSRWILLETGIGAFFPPKLKERFGVLEERHVLLDSLAKHGLSHEDIDVVVLSHLHFDHAGGLLSSYQEGVEPELLFPRARYVAGSVAWARAKAPHPRDRASFVPELNRLLEDSGRLEVVEGSASAVLGPDYRLHRSDGHTPGLVVTEVPGAHGPVVFASDLVPGRPWVRRALTMGYDRYPELLIDEKTELLGDVAARGGWLFFTHDPGCAAAKLVHEPSGDVGWAEPLERVEAWRA